MKYMGSKSRISKELAPIIQSYIDNNDIKNYIEPFVGGANMIDKIKCDHKIGCDIHYHLIAFLNALSKGYQPPYDISEEEYKYIQTHQKEYDSHFLGYVGFQLSYGAKWFGGYRRDKQGKRNYSHEAYNNVIKQAKNLKDTKFINCDFRDIKDIKNHVIYCDPPYKDTTKYSTNKFPYEEFYDWCAEMSKNNIVLVSEYEMPEDNFECIWQKQVKVMIDNNRNANDMANNRVEKLFIYKTK